MKKIITILLALILSLTAAFGASATEFVPSISYKDGPEIIEATLKGEEVSSCLIVTTIKEASEKSTDITEEERAKLLEVYSKLERGEMKLPLKNKYTVLELLDLSFMYEGCRENPDHKGKEALLNGGAALSVNFDLNVNANDNLKVLVCVNDEWKPVESVKINEDGTVTVSFTEICPVAFVIEEEAADTPVQDNNIGTIIAIVTAAVAAVTSIILFILKFILKK